MYHAAIGLLAAAECIKHRDNAALRVVQAAACGGRTRTQSELRASAAGGCSPHSPADCKIFCVIPHFSFAKKKNEWNLYREIFLLRYQSSITLGGMTNYLFHKTGVTPATRQSRAGRSLCPAEARNSLAFESGLRRLLPEQLPPPTAENIFLPQSDLDECQYSSTASSSR